MKPRLAFRGLGDGIIGNHEIGAGSDCRIEDVLQSRVRFEMRKRFDLVRISRPADLMPGKVWLAVFLISHPPFADIGVGSLGFGGEGLQFCRASSDDDAISYDYHFLIFCAL